MSILTSSHRVPMYIPLHPTDQNRVLGCVSRTDASQDVSQALYRRFLGYEYWLASWRVIAKTSDGYPLSGGVQQFYREGTTQGTTFHRTQMKGGIVSASLSGYEVSVFGVNYTTLASCPDKTFATKLPG